MGGVRRASLARRSIISASRVAAIVAVLESRQVSWHVFGPDGMVGSTQAVLEIAESGVDPFKGVFRCLIMLPESYLGDPIA